MPQMMPLNWINLFIYFIIIFSIFNSIIYFNYYIKMNNKKNKSYIKKINWKW